MTKRFRTKEIGNIPSRIEDLIPFLLKTHSEIEQAGGSQINWSIENFYDCGDSSYGAIEISYYSEETQAERESDERAARLRELREKEQYEKLRSKFEGINK